MNIPFKLALADWRLPVHGHEAVSLCKTHQISYLQIDFGGPGRTPVLDSIRQQQIYESSLEYSVQIIAIAGNIMNDIGLGLMASKEDEKKLKKLILSILDAAEKLSAPLVFFPSFRRSAIMNMEILKKTAEILRWTCQQAQARQLLIGNENDLDSSLSLNLVQEVSASNFRLIFDSFNPLVAKNSTFQLLKDLNIYFSSQAHLKDGLITQNVCTHFGDGEAEIEKILEALFGYSHIEYLILENDYRISSSLNLKKDIDWIKQFLHKISKDQQLNVT